jgi:hypothetical protein
MVGPLAIGFLYQFLLACPVADSYPEHVPIIAGIRVATQDCHHLDSLAEVPLLDDKVEFAVGTDGETAERLAVGAFQIDFN